jgi:hypothetical protein
MFFERNHLDATTRPHHLRLGRHIFPIICSGKMGHDRHDEWENLAIGYRNATVKLVV